MQIGIDIGKNSFHVIGLGMEGDIVLRRQFTRSGLIAFFKQKTERLEIAFEACSGAHWLAHQLLGERVFADETTLPTRMPGSGKTMTVWLWA